MLEFKWIALRYYVSKAKKEATEQIFIIKY